MDFWASVAAALLTILRNVLSEAWEIPLDEVDWQQVPPAFLVDALQGVSTFRMALFYLSHSIADWYSTIWHHSGILLENAAKVIHNVNLSFVRVPASRELMAVGRSLLSPAFALISVFIYHLFAPLLGGKGQLGRYAYPDAAFGAPITIIRPLLLSLPLATGSFVAVLPGTSLSGVRNWYQWTLAPFGWVITLITGAYWLSLVYFATKVEYGLTSGRTIVSVLLANLLILVLRTTPRLATMGLYAAIQLLR